MAPVKSTQRLARRFHQSLEGLRLPDGEIGKHLAIHLNTRKREAVDKSPIGQAMFAHTGIDALNPQGAELALALAPVAIGVQHRAFDRLHGGAEHIFAPAVITGSGVCYLLMSGMGCYTPFYASHISIP